MRWLAIVFFLPLSAFNTKAKREGSCLFSYALGLISIQSIGAAEQFAKGRFPALSLPFGQFHKSPTVNSMRTYKISQLKAKSSKNRLYPN